jgi:hypothetical protein
MSCEHGLSVKECYVCASPKYGRIPTWEERREQYEGAISSQMILDKMLEEIDDLRRALTDHKQKLDRLKHAMREAMYLLDQPEPRPHAAFSELLLALNPDLTSAKNKQDKNE